MRMLSLLIATVANWSGGTEELLRIDLCGCSYVQCIDSPAVLPSINHRAGETGVDMP
jgi:hypothetical protein